MKPERPRWSWDSCDSGWTIFVRMFAEFLGTMMFTFFVTSSWYGMEYFAAIGGAGPYANPFPAYVVNSLAVLLGFAIPAFLFIDISGAHFNPATTLGVFCIGCINCPMMLIYWLAQMAGGAVGSGILDGMIPAAIKTNGFGVTVAQLLGASVINPAYGYGVATGVELFITFFMVLTYLRYAVCHRSCLDPNKWAPPKLAPLVMGLVYAVVQFFALDISGASMNLARSFGPAIYSGNWTYLWVFVAGPFSGAIAAALVVGFITDHPHPMHMSSWWMVATRMRVRVMYQAEGAQFGKDPEYRTWLKSREPAPPYVDELPGQVLEVITEKDPLRSGESAKKMNALVALAELDKTD